MKNYVIGLDFGTLSVRGVLMDVSDGCLKAEAAADYAHGVMDRTLPDGTPLPKDWALQDPADYCAALDTVMPELSAAAADGQVVGIALDATTSTCTALGSDGIPLSFRYPNRPHAYTFLWKHHGAAGKAAEFEKTAKARKESWLGYYGDTINLEGYWPKLLQFYDEAPDLYAETDVYVDLPDMMVNYLTGRLVRAEMNLALKAYYCHGRLPSADYLEAVRPGLSSALSKLRGEILPASVPAGYLKPELQTRWQMQGQIPVAAGILDAHAGILATPLIAPGDCLAAIGTSACFICPGEHLFPVPGITGAIDCGLLPGVALYEAGQSCAGDGFAWFEQQLVPPYIREAADKAGLSTQAYLTSLAEKLRPGQSGLIALDWWNGNRSILNNASLPGLILGLTIRTRPEEIYRAFLESTVFGSRIIIENFQRHGLPIKRMILGGGIPRKNALLCQMYADTLHMEACVPQSSQGTAVGSAVSAAIAAGCFPNEDAAISALIPKGYTIYTPNPENSRIYDQLYAIYTSLTEQFGQTAQSAIDQLNALRIT